jgi:hypothetical protein
MLGITTLKHIETFEKCFPLKAGFEYKEGENLSADASLRVTGRTPPGRGFEDSAKASLRAKFEPDVGTK